MVGCPLEDCVVHRLHKLRAAVRIDEVVPGVVRYEDMVQATAFCNTSSNRQHYPVTERNDGGFHIILRVVSFRDGFCPFQERGTEILMDEAQRDYQVFQVEGLAVAPGALYLPGCVVAPIVKGDSQGDALLVFVQEGNGIHPAGENNYTIFHRCKWLRTSR